MISPGLAIRADNTHDHSRWGVIISHYQYHNIGNFSGDHDKFGCHHENVNDTARCFKAECNCFVTYMLLGMFGFVAFWSLLMLRIYLPEEYWKWSYVWSWHGPGGCQGVRFVKQMAQIRAKNKKINMCGMMQSCAFTIHIFTVGEAVGSTCGKWDDDEEEDSFLQSRATDVNFGKMAI